MAKKSRGQKESFCVCFDYSKLRKKIKVEFGSVAVFAKEIGMSTPALLSRLAGRSMFSITEIKACIRALRLDDQNAQLLFCTDRKVSDGTTM